MSNRIIITPYNRLMASMRKAWIKVKDPKRVTMWHYPKARLRDGWKLDDLWERVSAASSLGYDVCLTATEEGLWVHYVEKRPDSPSELN